MHVTRSSELSICVVRLDLRRTSFEKHGYQLVLKGYSFAI